ncbi:hypothetical protein KR054_008099, partial [Drosophila jambulina]
VRHGPKNQLLCQCGRYYNTLSRLMLHQREECQDFKRFQCDFCLKWFKRRSHLNRHKKLHDAELFLEPVHQSKQRPRGKAKGSANANAKTNDADDDCLDTEAAAVDLDPDILYTSEIKVETEEEDMMEVKYNLRTHEPSPEYPSGSRQKATGIGVGLRQNRMSENPPTPEASVAVEQKSENEEPLANSGDTSLKKAMASSDAMIALQQLASISTARSLQHLVQNMSNIDTSSLVPGRKHTRQALGKRSPQYESNRCPLCSRTYRSQASLNEHMRKEHSVLI